MWYLRPGHYYPNILPPTNVNLLLRYFLYFNLRAIRRTSRTHYYIVLWLFFSLFLHILTYSYRFLHILTRSQHFFPWITRIPTDTPLALPDSEEIRQITNESAIACGLAGLQPGHPRAPQGGPRGPRIEGPIEKYRWYQDVDINITIHTYKSINSDITISTIYIIYIYI